MPEPLTLQENATAIVDVLMRRRGLKSASRLGAASGIPKAHLQDRLAGRAEWSADDLAELARFFGVPARVFAYSLSSLRTGEAAFCITCMRTHQAQDLGPLVTIHGEPGFARAPHHEA